MIGRSVSRARGRVLRVAGMPKLPNMPSARALAQNELRHASRIGSSGRRRSRSTQDQNDPTPRKRRTNPYEDPSRDLGEGPDELSKIQSVMLFVGIMIGIYIAVASCNPTIVIEAPTNSHCHTCSDN